MDPFTLIMAIMVLLLPILATRGLNAYQNKVLEPRREEAREIQLAARRERQLDLEHKQAQDAALTLEDKIWLFDMGRTEWTPEDEVGFKPEFNGTNTLVFYAEDGYGTLSKKAYLWDLPDWYVDFLSTRPFHSDLAKKFYDWACEGKDVKTHIAEMKQERDKRIAKERADEEEEKRRWREHQKEMRRLEEERLAKAKADRLERERREREERKKRSLELEEKRRKNLGLTGNYLDEVRRIYRSESHHVWHDVGNGGRIVRFAPRTKASLAIKQLQEEFGLPVTGYIDIDTLREIEVQVDVDDYVTKRPVRVISERHDYSKYEVDQLLGVKAIAG